MTNHEQRHAGDNVDDLVTLTELDSGFTWFYNWPLWFWLWNHKTTSYAYRTCITGGFLTERDGDVSNEYQSEARQQERHEVRV